MPAVLADQRNTFFNLLIDRRGEVLQNRAIVTIRGERIRHRFRPHPESCANADRFLQSIPQLGTTHKYRSADPAVSPRV